MKRYLPGLLLCMSVLCAPALSAAAAPDDVNAGLAASGQGLQVAFIEEPPVVIVRAPVHDAGDALGEAYPFTCAEEDAGEPDRTYAYANGDDLEARLAACSADGVLRPDAFTSDGMLYSGYLSEPEDLQTAADISLPDVPVVVNKNVESFIKYFQTRGRKHFVRWLGRSSNYMAMLQEILRDNGLPEDLAYIAFIESGLNPTARSRAKAVGMWQFIKGTAKKYGLRVDWWIDERMDPEKATYAAAKYFKNLYDQFGSWYLAAAGYNAGEGRVMRAMRKHNTEDFWELASYRRPLKRETKEYVPKYLAAMLIAKDPKSYGFDEEYDSESLKYDKVKVPQATDLRLIAEAAQTTPEEIKRLNPELLHWFTPPDYPNYEVKIPAGNADAFADNFNRLPAAARVAFTAHKVRRGETIAKIARKYGTETASILYLNNFKTASYIKPGTVILVPAKADSARRQGREVAEAVTMGQQG